MSIVSKIIGGRNSNQMNITDDKQASVIDASYPAPLSKKFTIPFRDYFKDTDGDNNMLGSGTLTSFLDFTINAEDETLTICCIIYNLLLVLLHYLGIALGIYEYKFELPIMCKKINYNIVEKYKDL